MNGWIQALIVIVGAYLLGIWAYLRSVNSFLKDDASGDYAAWLRLVGRWNSDELPAFALLFAFVWFVVVGIFCYATGVPLAVMFFIGGALVSYPLFTDLQADLAERRQKRVNEQRWQLLQEEQKKLVPLALPFLSAAREVFAPYASLPALPSSWQEKHAHFLAHLKAVFFLLPAAQAPWFTPFRNAQPFNAMAQLSVSESFFSFASTEQVKTFATGVVEAMLKTPGARAVKGQLDNTALLAWFLGHDWRAEFRPLAAELEQAVQQELTAKGGLVIGKPFTDGQRLLYKPPNLLPVSLTQPDRFKHTYVIGKTGSGKSTLLKTLIAQDLTRNVGVIVISPENGLFDDLAALIPPQRFNDLLYFDPTDTTPPVIGFNPLHFEQGEDLTQKAEETYTIFSAALGDLGVTMQPLLQNAIYALLQHPSASLNDLDRLLYPQDASFRRELLRVPHLDEPTRKFWQEYDKSSYYKKSYDAVINRLNPFFRPPLVDIFSTPSFSFHHVLNVRPTIFFANLSKLRGVQAQVVGQLLLAQLQQTLLRRDSQPEQSRIPSFLFIDEFQTYAATSEGALVELFNRARKYNMGVTLAHQVTADIPAKLLSVITGNVGTLVAMQTNAEDAPFFTKELQLKDTEGHARPDLLQNLKTGQAFARTPALTAGVPISVSPVAPPESRNVSAYCQNLKKVSKLNFGKQPQAQANGRSDEAFTPPPPPPEEEPAQASSSTNARRKTTSRKAKPEPPPPPDDEENFKM